MDRVWHLTQTPAEHRKWDLRFTDIDYLPRPDPSQPQRFRYATRIGFGLTIRGDGETVGTHDSADGSRASALKFWSDDPKSLIREGSGYWKYLPHANGVSGGTRFLTRYDYDVRFHTLGRLFDRFVFRPLMGWATAWSFDRLRLWIECDIAPHVALRAAAVYTVARLGLVAVWLYHGLVPKLMTRHPDEFAPLADVGIRSVDAQALIVRAAGVGEIVFGLLMLLLWRSRWPLWLTAAAMPCLALSVILTTPRLATSAFNVVTFNGTVCALAVVALLVADLVPSARRCVRRPEGD